jgi:putative endonuclease
MHGETLVARWYERRGYRIVDRNWRDGRRGELDIVAEGPGGLIVFCEVKARATVAYGHPFEAITPDKVARIRRLAAAWMAAHPERRGAVRIDAAAVLGASVEVREGIG